MSLESFLKLKEIDSLGKMRINYLKAIGSQQERISKLLERKEMTTLQTTTLKHEQHVLQQSIFELEKKLKTFTEQKENLLSIGGDEKKIASFTSEIGKLEDEGFALFEKVENHQTEIEDLKTFALGLEKTIAEIQSEIDLENSGVSKEIASVDLRLKLLEELPADFRALYLKTVAKKLVHGSFTRIEQGSCFFCRYRMSRQDETEIDQQHLLKTCPQCGRIFLPFGA